MILGFGVALLLIALGALAYRQIAGSHRLDWVPEPAIDRYRPMLRLLDEADIEFLRTQPGSTPTLMRCFRRQRCRLFREYLRSLERDFHAASHALILIVIHSPRDRRDLLRALFVARWRFAAGIFRVRGRLLLYRCNVSQEPVAQLVSLFEGLQLELLALAPATATLPPS